MDATAVIADVVPPPQPHAFSTFNISLNLTSFLASLPARFLARIRRGAVAADLPTVTATISQFVRDDSWTLGTPIEAHDITSEVSNMRNAASNMDPMLINGHNAPGNLSFFTSMYMLGLCIMAIVLHRMQNIIIPSRVTPQRPTRRAGQSRDFLNISRHFHSIYTAFLPLDLSQTTTRLAIHLPTLYFSSKMLVLWTLLVLQTSNCFPTAFVKQHGLTWLEKLANWSQQQEMTDICWSTFCAICATFCVEAFVKALDGIGSGFPLGGNMNPSTSPFILVGYAFFLHAYSSPSNHTDSPVGLPSRPDKHIVITIAIPLLQLTIFHYLSVSKRLSTHRLIPTALSSLLSLIHFHSTFYSYLASSTSSTFLPFPPTKASQTQNETLATKRPAPLIMFPFPNYIPNMFETMLILSILLTITLNVIVQLLVRGRVERLFIGLGVTPGTSNSDEDVLNNNNNDRNHTSGMRIPFDEDFGVLLLRMGSASFEATGLRGWANEVAPVPAPGRRRKPISSLKSSKGNQKQYGIVRVGRASVGNVIHHGRRKGLRNEVRRVDLGVSQGDTSLGWRHSAWSQELWRYLCTLWGVIKGSCVLLWGVLRGKKKFYRGVGVNAGLNASDTDGFADMDMDNEARQESEVPEDRDERLYSRFLRGDNISDDEGDDDEFDGEGLDEVNRDNDSEEDLEDDVGDDESSNEATTLIRDLVRNGEEGTWAHFLLGSTSNSKRRESGPLTRRRWGAMLQRPDSDELDNPNIAFQSNGVLEDDSASEPGKATHALCVVCISETRDVICWPCRCLAMCDNCREVLSSKSPPTKHRCPCCRQIVEGYSKIYIP